MSDDERDEMKEVVRGLIMKTPSAIEMFAAFRCILEAKSNETMKNTFMTQCADFTVAKAHYDELQAILRLLEDLIPDFLRGKYNAISMDE